MLYQNITSSLFLGFFYDQLTNQLQIDYVHVTKN